MRIRSNRIKTSLKIIVSFGWLFLSSYALAYSAVCDTQDGKRFYIEVKDKVMRIDQKYSAFYKERTADEFYVYSNKAYVYAAGRIVDGRMPIAVKNKWGLDTVGTCELKN